MTFVFYVCTKLKMFFPLGLLVSTSGYKRKYYKKNKCNKKYSNKIKNSATSAQCSKKNKNKKKKKKKTNTNTNTTHITNTIKPIISKEVCQLLLRSPIAAVSSAKRNIILRLVTNPSIPFRRTFATYSIYFSQLFTMWLFTLSTEFNLQTTIRYNLI